MSAPNAHRSRPRASRASPTGATRGGRAAAAAPAKTLRADEGLRSPRTLLGGLSPQQFMRRHWQKRPLLIRQAWPGVQPPATRLQLRALCGQDGVESRCVEQRDGQWRLRHGPLNQRQVPAWSQPGWTLLVQGLDLHLQAAHEMLRAFDFLPQVRLDDLMMSYATEGGGVGPHVDSYDVFLLQVQGRRRWSIAPPGDQALVPGLPLRILANFQAEQEWVLEPGDMLYLPPGWQHDGVAMGPDCMTASIGFRAPQAGELAVALMQHMADDMAELLAEEGAEEGTESPREAAAGPWLRRHADPGLAATSQSGAIPEGLATFAQRAVTRLLGDEAALQRALGVWLTEPKPQVWFDPAPVADLQGRGVALDRRTRMAYDARHLFINGEAFRVGGADARLLRQLADRRCLPAPAVARLSAEAYEALCEWHTQGWLRAHWD